MNISILCDKINMQPDIRKRVLSFVDNYDFQAVDESQKGYFTYNNMSDALSKTQAILGEDTDGIKILSSMLRASLKAYDVYQQKGISDEIYFDTMKCFSRFIDEIYKMTGKLYFDRSWWTTRQVGGHLFRIGELEYEIKHLDEVFFISLHIPSDADFSPVAVEKSLQDADEFFAKHFPHLSGAEYRCHSWLLDGQLKSMLRKDSNIVSFQNRFEIFDEGEVNNEFIGWLFNTKSTDYATLPENTSLQRNVKKHLLSGGVIRNAYGRIKA